MADEPIRWPTTSQHALFIGRNGSGKTTAGIYDLSFQNWETMPWLMVDVKGDEYIEKIGKMPNVKTLKWGEAPGKAGLHIIRVPPHQMENLEDLLWHCYQRGRIGVYVDEGHSLNKSEALPTLLTQGRSKQIPCRICTQRPTWVSRSCFSEPSFFQVFSLTDRRDRKTVQEFIPIEQCNLETPLPEFWSWWYDVKANRATPLKPVPPGDAILQSFRARLQPKRIAI